MLDDFIYIRKKIKPVSISVNEIVGILTPDANEIQNLKNLFIGKCLEEFVLVDGKNKSIEQISDGQEIQIQLFPLKLSNEKYYETLEELLRFSSQEYPDNRFYVHSLEFDSKHSAKPKEIQNFEATTQLINFLIGISDYQKERELVFFQAKQLVLTTDYDIVDLTELKDVSALITHISDSADKEERKIIFINELISSLMKIPEMKNRFKHLLKNFEDLFVNYKKSHSLYLEKYSYTKFKSEIDKEIIDYSKKLQSVINDAQSKLVAIPVAFLIIIGQFDLTGEKIYFNIALILSALVFSILLEVLLRNQFSALEFISDDVTRFESSVDEKKIALLGDDFTTTFAKIRTLYRQQKCYLNIIRVLVWLSTVFAIGLFMLSLANNTLICIFKSFLGF
ncbi:MAG TPA: hypothetical protein VK179_16425 [Bacteroidales bacterium]|nr:hypothetical protein [Bacteroidales bacterium]